MASTASPPASDASTRRGTGATTSVPVSLRARLPPPFGDCDGGVLPEPSRRSSVHAATWSGAVAPCAASQRQRVRLPSTARVHTEWKRARAVTLECRRLVVVGERGEGGGRWVVVGGREWEWSGSGVEWVVCVGEGEGEGGTGREGGREGAREGGGGGGGSDIVFAMCV